MTDAWRFYERFAHEWDRDRSKPDQGLMERRYLDDVRSRLSPGAHILDLGCGTGEPMARYLIGSGVNVTGVDAAPAMIAICRQRFPESTWIEADMRTLDLGHRFDAIIAWDSFFHLGQDEQRRMFPIFQRHITTGGLLLFTSGPEAGAAIGTMYGEALFHASLAPDEYRRLLARHGMRVLLYSPEDPDCASIRSGSPKQTSEPSRDDVAGHEILGEALGWHASPGPGKMAQNDKEEAWRRSFCRRRSSAPILSPTG